MTSVARGRDAESRNVRLVGHTSLEGIGDGMHVNLKDGYAYFAHVGSAGTSIVDVRDPRDPRLVDRIPAAPNTHSHKVQVLGDIMLINRERALPPLGGTERTTWLAGLSIYDVSHAATPREIAFWSCGGRGVHRMTYWSEPYAYVTAGSSDFEQQFLIVLDLSDPTRPTEVGRWWFPGMRRDEADLRTWPEDKIVKLHHAIPSGNRLYCGWWDLGLVILDSTDPTNPALVGHLNIDAVDGPSAKTHSAAPILGTNSLVVTDEVITGDVCNIHDPGGMEYHARIVDIEDEAHPKVIARFPVPDDRYCHCSRAGRLGPHNVHEMRPGSFQQDSLVFMTWFNGGLRIYDLSDLTRPREVAHYVPPAPPGRSSGQLNDVFVDADGLIYTTERYGGGLHILELDLD